MSRYVGSANNENRNVTERPTFNIANYKTYTAEYEKFYNDNLPFRSKWISMNSKLDFFLFKKSPSDDVILGEDGWLFYLEELPDFQKNNLYTKEQLEATRKEVLQTKNYLNNLGIEFYVFIAPNKTSIYGEYMPDYMDRKEGASRTQQLVDYLQMTTDVNIIFPKRELQQAANDYSDMPLFFKLDTHWNYLGGYYGSKILLEKMGIEMPVMEELTYEVINEPVFYWNGYDLANMMGLSDVLDVDVNYNLSGYSTSKVIYDGDVPNDVGAFNTYCRTFSDAPDSRRVLLVRDSFATAMMPYLAAQFQEIYSPFAHYMTKEQIAEEAPDILIVELVERKELRGRLISSWED
ncbi:MAG: hypothetical protein ACI4E5_12175 [Suilimivivens sp.]